MPAGNDFNNQQIKQQAQYLNMRGAQIAEQNAGQKTELGSQPKAQGSKKATGWNDYWRCSCDWRAGCFESIERDLTHI